ncbi:MFS transporter [Streptomyces sp. A7024]|uniref:MFS transporter n=1 Tax=Streptomyces coryli TaxID=1128680 RepID=A0A6G4UDQ2_9ACTN|nr:MFS transporter [Streptomyces coryli]
MGRLVPARDGAAPGTPQGADAAAGADGPDGAGAAKPLPPRPGLLVTLGLVAAAAFLAEGAASDWAGVYVRRELGAAAATAPLVSTAFFATMTAVRFAGDAIRARLGAPTTLRLAGMTATAGYALVLFAPVAAGGPGPAAVGWATAGWALVGAGAAVMWPVLAGAVGAAVAGSGGGASRLSLVTTIGYGGGLAGPALIGYVAERTSLPAALSVPAVLAAAVALIAPAAIVAVSRGPRQPVRYAAAAHAPGPGEPRR